MSKIVLGWQLSRTVDNDEVENVISDIKQRYQPLFKDLITHSGLWHRNQGLLHFDIQKEGESGIYLDNNKIICSTGKPRIIVGESHPQVKILNTLSLFETMVTETNKINSKLIHHIDPPFTLTWFDRSNQKLGVIHDGLGYDQFFVSNSAHGVVISNKCWPILRLLQTSPKINYEGWKYWFTLGWFPDDQSPFSGIRVLDKGEILECDGKNIISYKEDPFYSWTKYADHNPQSAMIERAQTTFNQIILAYAPEHDSYKADLTAGLDSRTVFSSVVKHNIPCELYTEGSRLSTDAIVAERIAKKFGRPWVHISSKLPQDESFFDAIRFMFNKMLLWSEGLVEPNRFKHFAIEPSESKITTHLTGGRSEISRGFYYKKVLKNSRSTPCNVRIRGLLGFFERVKDSIICSSESFKLQEILMNQIFEGEKYGLQGFDLLDFFYVNQRARRWASAHDAVNLFNTKLSPYLNIDHIILAFSMEPYDKADDKFQNFIIQNNIEELLDIPINENLYNISYYHWLQLMTNVKYFNKLYGNLTWHDHFRNNGQDMIDLILSNNTPLWEIIDKSKVKQKCQNFFNETDNDLFFLLRLISFHYWHEIFIQESV